MVYAYRVSVGQWVIEFRDNNWIYITDKGWVEFDEKLFVDSIDLLKRRVGPYGATLSYFLLIRITS